MGKLTLKQERFCREYIIDSNATQAAIRAGYSEKTAMQQASRLLRNVNLNKKIQELRDDTFNDLKIETQDIIRELSSVAFQSMDQFVYINDLGEIHLRPNVELTGVSNLSVSTSENGQSFSIKISDKLNALKELAKIIGAYDQNEKKESSSIGRILESIRKLGE